jgi:tetratricopeptide (TPR) repeat protein
MSNTGNAGKAIRALAVLGSVVMILGTAEVAKAQARERAAVQQEFQAAFDVMLKNPADAQATTRYAELAVELGDYESAIPPLERLLMLNPKLTDVRLEIGVLYFLLHSGAMAREYLEAVDNDPEATPEQKRRATEYLARI